MAEATEYSKRKENSPGTQNITSGKTIRPSHSSTDSYSTIGATDLGRGPKTTVKSGDNVIAQGNEDQAEKWREMYQGAKGKVDDIVGAIIDWLNEDPYAIEEPVAPKDEPMVSAKSEEIPMEMTLSQRLEVIDPHNKQEILNLQKDIGMPEQELDGVYGPMTDAWLKAHLLDNGLEMTDAARFNLGLNEFSESPANHAYREHLRKLEEERRLQNTPDPTITPAPQVEPDPQIESLRDIPLEGAPQHELWPAGISEEEKERIRAKNRAAQIPGSGVGSVGRGISAVQDGLVQTKQNSEPTTNIVEDVNNSIYDFLGTPEEMRWMGILSHYFDSPSPNKEDK